MKLGFIGFGGAGHGLAKGLKRAGVDGIHFYDRMQDTPPYAEATLLRNVGDEPLPVESASSLQTEERYPSRMAAKAKKKEARD